MLRSLAGFLCLSAAVAQTPPSKLEFEVASIRPAEALDKMVASGKMHVGMQVDGARVDIGAMAIPDLIQIAYKVKRHQLQNAGADGLTAQRFDILAKLPEGANKDQVPDMLQALLEDRFKLKIHREKKEMPVYSLVIAKGGPKLKEAPPDADTPPPDDPGATKIGNSGVQFKANGSGGVVMGGPMGKTKVEMRDGAMHFEMEKMPIAALTEFLARFLDRPVVDMTELKGNYQIALEISMEELKNVARSMGAAVPGGPAGEAGKAPLEASDPSGSLFTAVQQLGLKLEPRKAPVEIIVVDHVEKMPTEN
jgi:uncharacterized protein (TIGR03435 family)